MAQHADLLAERAVQLGGVAKGVVQEAEQAGDSATADSLTGVARDIDKLRWLVESHAQAER